MMRGLIEAAGVFMFSKTQRLEATFLPVR